jgi:glycosyltransferase involved in cell wall biosynthesis
MKVVFLTPGTGNFYCGSCLRDHGLAKAMMAEGWDVTMLPLYLPHVAEDEIGDRPVFFGGLKVYFQQYIPGFRYLPKWMTSWMDHPSILSFVSRFAGMTSASTLGRMTLSTLDLEKSGQFDSFVEMSEWMGKTLNPDVIVLSNALLLGFASPLKKRLGCRVFCTLQGEDTFIDSLPQEYREKCWAKGKEQVQYVDSFMAVSRRHGEIMSEGLGIPEGKLKVVYNGIDLDGVPELVPAPEVPTLGFLANIVPPKGLMALAEAFIAMKEERPDQPLRLSICGSVTPFTQSYLDEVKDKLRGAGVDGDTHFGINLTREEKYKALQEMTLLSVPAVYGESFGLYVLEALAVGVPVVQPNHGAFPEVMEVTGGGLIYDSQVKESHTQALWSLIDDREKREQLGREGYEVVHRQFSTGAMARHVIECLEEEK